jgi:hypothetical protein
VSRKVFNTAAGGKPVLAGPGWSSLNMHPAVRKWWLDSVAATLNMVTLHVYAGDIFSNPNIEDLLSDKVMVGISCSPSRRALVCDKASNMNWTNKMGDARSCTPAN